MSQDREKRTGRMIVRARVVVTMDGPPIENGAVAIAGDRIVAVGKFSEVTAEPGEVMNTASAKIVDLGESALLPGLINTHCHLDYTCLRGKIPRQKSFANWIRAINAEKAKLSSDDYLSSINEGFVEARKFGTTTIANLTAFPELVAHVRQLVRTWWFAELIDVRDPNRAPELVDRALETLKSSEHWGLAPHAPFTASAHLYRYCEEIARQQDALLTTHLAESSEERSMFQDARGPLYDFLSAMGRDMSDCGGTTPLALFLSTIRDSSVRAGLAHSLGMTKDWMLAHLNELTEKDFDLLARSKMNLSVVHCPRSHNYFGHSPFQFEKLRKLGLNICLGTDSLASNEDLGLFGEMRAFQGNFSDVPSEEILAMVTINAARALRRENQIGKIAPGFDADLIALPCESSANVLDEIIAFDRIVNWLMLGGTVQQTC